MHPAKIVGIGCLGFLSVTVFATIAIAALTSDSNDEPSTPTATETPVDPDSVREAAGLPPAPNPATERAYIDALNAIDPRIAKPGKDDQTVSRGLNQCSSIKNSPDDEAKLAQLALDRFTVTTRLPEISTPETGAKITEVVHTHLCPDF
ncbi:hypothetical protein [Streptomyces sp. WMMC897]|uniref:hypothetical protein n=1 Tax=Streptomyces sp. WMMC897 TaxID=3014782 RepID=UPI0022B619DC|nr:hypothetical protein [Streptomyces sp. WMMC897]MCZ7414299.1 hypothetical protein [Streptomyces sp. WMMC897]